MSTLERAIEIAASAHAGQVDKAGAPYVLHPLRMMLRMSDNQARMVAVLHDVIEDTPWSLEQLREQGFADSVLTAVDALTRRQGETYEAFILRAASDPIARLVKIADLEDNSDLSRFASPSDKDRSRIEKYQRALQVLRAQCLMLA
jgi:(p)ppGpp synthase/HD superfamily hydrolase